MAVGGAFGLERDFSDDTIVHSVAGGHLKRVASTYIRSISLWGCLLVLLANGDISFGAAAEELARLKDTYEGLSAKIEDEAILNRRNALTSYGQGLSNIKDRLKAAADLDGVLAVNKEITRFQTEKTMPADAAGLPPAVAQLHANIQKYLEARQAERDQKQADLIRQYLTPLLNLKKTLTMNEKLDEAILVDAEIKRIQVVLAEIDARLSKVQTKPAVVSPVTPTTPVTPSPVGMRKNFITNGDFEGRGIAPWKTGGYGAVITTEIDKTSPHAGSAALRFGHESANDPSLIQGMTVPPGEYVLTVWVKVLENTKGLGLKVTAEGVNDDLFQMKPGEDPGALKNWQKYETDIKVKNPAARNPKSPKPEEIPPNCIVRLRCLGIGMMLLDDITLTPK